MSRSHSPHVDAPANGSANGNGNGRNGNGRLTYSEIRQMARWMDAFTPSDLADALHVAPEMGAKAIKALLWHGIAIDTGDQLDGPLGEEPIIEMRPLPPGPNEHHTETPVERLVGYTDVLCPRGLPIRLIDNTKKRDGMQSPGSRRRIQQKERAYEAMQKAIAERQAQAKARKRSKDEHRRVSIAEVRRREAAEAKPTRKRNRSKDKQKQHTY